MEINIDAKAIEQAVSDAVVKSAIGAKIAATVHDLLSKSYDNPIDAAIKQVVKDIAIHEVQEHYKEKIELALKEKLTDEAIQKVANHFWDQVYRNW